MNTVPADRTMTNTVLVKSIVVHMKYHTIKARLYSNAINHDGFSGIIIVRKVNGLIESAHRANYFFDGRKLNSITVANLHALASKYPSKVTIKTMENPFQS